MYQYTKEDLDNILAFNSAINSDYFNFENNVLTALAKIFFQHLTVYTVFKLDAEGKMYVSRISSNSIQPEIIERYRSDLYQKDPFLKNYAQICASNPSRAFFTEDSLTPGVFQSSEYAQFLKKYNIAHEAIVGVNDPNGNMINIIIYKYANAGCFTEQEKALFQYIGQVFNQSKALRRRSEHQQRRLDAMLAGAEDPTHGLAVIDSKGRLLFNNSLFMTYGARLSSGLSKEAVVRDVLFAAIGENKAPRGKISHQQAHIDNMCISLQSKRAQLAGREDELLIIKIVKEDEKSMAKFDQIALLHKYGLTRREAEVLVLAAKGYNNQQIADELYIGVSTVKSHMGNVFGKLSVSSRAELLRKLRTDTTQ